MMKNKELFQRDPTTSKLLNDGVAAVKDAVTDGLLDERRYESYCHLLSGQVEE